MATIWPTLSQIHSSWWRYQMETFSALLALCEGNSPVTGEFPSQRPVTRSFDLFFDLCLNKWLKKQSCGLWFGTPSRPLWRQCNDVKIDVFTCRKSLFSRVQSTMTHHWFRNRLGTEKSTSHYRNQWCLICCCIYALLILGKWAQSLNGTKLLTKIKSTALLECRFQIQSFMFTNHTQSLCRRLCIKCKHSKGDIIHQIYTKFYEFQWHIANKRRNTMCHYTYTLQIYICMSASFNASKFLTPISTPILCINTQSEAKWSLFCRRYLKHIYLRDRCIFIQILLKYVYLAISHHWLR